MFNKLPGCGTLVAALAKEDTVPSFIGRAETSQGSANSVTPPCGHSTTPPGWVTRGTNLVPGSGSPRQNLLLVSSTPAASAPPCPQIFVLLLLLFLVGFVLASLFCLTLSTVEKHTESLTRRGLLPPRPPSRAFATNELNC